MKTKKLSKKELKETNGGSLLNSGDSSSSNALGGSLGIGNLLSTSQSSQNGDDSQSSSFSAGNGINLDAAQISKKMTE